MGESPSHRFLRGSLARICSIRQRTQRWQRLPTPQITTNTFLPPIPLSAPHSKVAKPEIISQCLINLSLPCGARSQLPVSIQRQDSNICTQEDKTPGKVQVQHLNGNFFGTGALGTSGFCRNSSHFTPLQDKAPKV